MCDQQSLRSACANAQSDQSLLLLAWVFYDCLATDWTPFGVSKLKMRLQRLIRVYTCQNATLLETSCTGSKSCQCMRLPTMWYVRPAKPQMSLRIRAVWSEPLANRLGILWLFSYWLNTIWSSKLKMRLQMLIRVYTCQKFHIVGNLIHWPIKSCLFPDLWINMPRRKQWKHSETQRGDGE